MPGWQVVRNGRRTLNHFESSRFVILGCFQSGLFNRHRSAADDIAGPEFMFGLRRLTNADQKLTVLIIDPALEAQDVTR